MKNREIVKAVEAFRELMKVKLPSEVTFKLVKLFKKVEAESKDIYAARDVLIGRYGAENERGQMSILSESENWPEFVKEYDIVLNADCESEFEPAKVKIPQSVEISVETCLALLPFIEFEGE